MKEGRPPSSADDLFKYASSAHKGSLHAERARSECEWGDGGKRFFFSTTLETNTINKSKRNREGSVYVTGLQRVPLFPRWARPACLFICGDSGLHHSPFTRGTLNSFLRKRWGGAFQQIPENLKLTERMLPRRRGDLTSPRGPYQLTSYFTVKKSTKAERHQLYCKTTTTRRQ